MMKLQGMKMGSGRKSQSMEQAKKLLSKKGSHFLPFMTNGGGRDSADFKENVGIWHK